MQNIFMYVLFLCHKVWSFLVAHLPEHSTRPCGAWGKRGRAGRAWVGGDPGVGPALT